MKKVVSALFLALVSLEVLAANISNFYDDEPSYVGGGSNDLSALWGLGIGFLLALWLVMSRSSPMYRWAADNQMIAAMFIPAFTAIMAMLFGSVF